MKGIRIDQNSLTLEREFITIMFLFSLPSHILESFTPQALSPSSPSTNDLSIDFQAPSKNKMKTSRGDEMVDLIVSSLKNLQRKEYERVVLDEAGHFGHQIVATVRLFMPRQMTLAKLQIKQVLFNIEFPVEMSLQTTSTP